MTDKDNQSHRQEREHRKQEHAHSTPGKYLTSQHLTWGLVFGVVLMGAAVLVWTVFLPMMRSRG